MVIFKRILATIIAFPLFVISIVIGLIFLSFFVAAIPLAAIIGIVEYILEIENNISTEYPELGVYLSLITFGILIDWIWDTNIEERLENLSL